MSRSSPRNTVTRSGIAACTLRQFKPGLLLTVLFAVLFPFGAVYGQTDLGVAVYNDQQELQLPANLDEWVHLGSSLGSDYNEEAFDPENPGTLGVVLMEPTAYRHFKQEGEYADGSMFLLTFYRTASKSDPQLQGFVQGAMGVQEIHVIDSARFTEGQAFFVYSDPQQQSAAKLPDGSECVSCHNAEGDYRGTFIQFYPTIRDLPRK